MYDHHTKAGNPGDVIKHVALIAAANVLMKTRNGTFHYADTYAGYAYNPLNQEGEWRNGIGQIHDGGIKISNPDVLFWRELWECKYGLVGSVYPGSSIFIRKLCLKNDIAFQPRLWDVSSAVISQLMIAYKPCAAEIYPRPASVNDFRGSLTDLLLIDPPGFQAQMPYLGNLLQFFDEVENVILWLPFTTENGIESIASSEAHQECRDKGLSIITVMWGGTKSTRGCRVACQLPQTALLAIEHAVSQVDFSMGWQMSKG